MTSEQYWEQFISTHPNLYNAMIVTWPNREITDYARGRVDGLIASVSIVGGFDTCFIERKLCEATDKA